MANTPDFYRLNSYRFQGLVGAAIGGAFAAIVIGCNINTPSQWQLPVTSVAFVCLPFLFGGAYLLYVGLRSRIEFTDEAVTLRRFRASRVPLEHAVSFVLGPWRSGEGPSSADIFLERVEGQDLKVGFTFKTRRGVQAIADLNARLAAHGLAEPPPAPRPG